MKRIFTLFSIVIISGQLSTLIAVGPTASIEWETTSIDLADIPIHQPVKVDFIFKNPGMVPIIISEVKPSCGCTVADFPKQPILSGTQGKITVTYDAELSGFFSKTISVYSNTDEEVTELFIKGTVVK